MIKIETIDSELKDKLIECLYKDELLNIQLIHNFESRYTSKNGDVYIEIVDNRIASILQVQFDGNSNFTNFYATSLEGLNAISMQIRENKYKNQLIAGRKSEVAYILKQLGQNRDVGTSYYYRLNQQQREIVNLRSSTELRKVDNGEDVEIIKKYLIDYFEADSEETINKITSDKKLSDMIENGLYILYDKESPIGMARFLGYSNLYTCITTVYIDSKYRSNGYGKVLLASMLEEAHRINKIPVLQVHSDNKSAIRIYEEIGFEIEYEYSFEFI